jgi:hypothetical protein
MPRDARHRSAQGDPAFLVIEAWITAGRTEGLKLHRLTLELVDDAADPASRQHHVSTAPACGAVGRAPARASAARRASPGHGALVLEILLDAAQHDGVCAERRER